jgi:hypothetical protein
MKRLQHIALLVFLIVIWFVLSWYVTRIFHI